LGLSQDSLAKLCGVSRYTVVRWEQENGCHPRQSRMKRFRDLWLFSEKARTEAFMQDRQEAVDFK
jgi:predicted transcriptional regulator